jgi:hypothetical protein
LPIEISGERRQHFDETWVEVLGSDQGSSSSAICSIRR